MIITTSRGFARPALALGLLLALSACRDTPPATGNEPASALQNEVGENGFPIADTDQTEGWLVVYNDDVSSTDRQRALIAAGATLVYELRYIEGAVVTASDEQVELLRQNPNVKAVYLNTVFATQQAYQTSALYWRRGVQWDMRQIEANLAATRGTGVRVCIIDSPVSTTHRDFVGKVAASAHFPGSANWTLTADLLGHGSHVGSTVTTNGIGLASVAPGATLLSANVFGPAITTSVAQVLEAIMWCRSQQADVINMSLGGKRNRGSTAWKSDSAAYRDFITIARGSGIVVVSSAGNDATALPNASVGYVPAEVPGVMSVGATGPADSRTLPFSPQAPHPSFDLLGGYSNHNSGNNSAGPGVRIYAPGGTRSVLSHLRILGVCNSAATWPLCGTNSYFGAYGTSMAAPHVSGVVALITQRYLGQTRNLTRVNRIESCLLQTADALPAGTPFFGRGRVNARRATTEACPGL